MSRNASSMPAQLHDRVALVAGATRGAGRGIAVALGEAGATVYCTGRSSGGRRSEYDRPETIEETAELVDRRRRHRHRRRGRPPRARTRSGRWSPDRRRAGPARRARQRHLGRRAALRVEHARVGARPRERPPAAAAGDRHAPDHEPRRAAAADPRARRARGRDDRRHARSTTPRTTGSRSSTTSPRPRCSGSRSRRREELAPARRHGRRAHPRLAPLGDDARQLRRDRGDLARRRRRQPALRRDLRVAALRRASRRRAGRRPGRARAATAARSHRASWRGSTASRTSTARRPDCWRYMVEVQDAGLPADPTGYR